MLRAGRLALAKIGIAIPYSIAANDRVVPRSPGTALNIMMIKYSFKFEPALLGTSRARCCWLVRATTSRCHARAVFDYRLTADDRRHGAPVYLLYSNAKHHDIAES